MKTILCLGALLVLTAALPPYPLVPEYPSYKYYYDKYVPVPLPFENVPEYGYDPYGPSSNIIGLKDSNVLGGPERGDSACDRQTLSPTVRDIMTVIFV